ncbi:MAG: hypothetical protein IPP13_20775 [Kouleothrix sp.]|jgi:hypothetical protein|nr:hypothetical protein [Kouleothrix sp.]
MSHGTPESNSSRVELLPEQVAALLDRAQQARKRGDLPAARALLHALAAHRPEMPQVWMVLAAVAETRAEQRHALERVIALDPQNPLAQRGLARINAATPAPAAAAIQAPTAPPPQLPTPAEEFAPAAVQSVAAARPGVGSAPLLTPTTPTAAERARAIRWPLYLVIAVAALIALAALWWLRSTDAPTAAPAATPALPGVVAAPTPAAATAAALLDTAPAVDAATTVLPTPARPTSAPTSVATLVPTLVVGRVVASEQWHAVLLRPDDAVPIDGSISTFQPQGRFWLALVAIGNDGAAPARMPADLVVLIDRSGQRYLPQPALSTAYLAAYGRGQRGDLSMEDEIPADGGNKSIPLIFDLPPSARELTLVVRGSVAGWPVGAQAR